MASVKRYMVYLSRAYDDVRAEAKKVLPANLVDGDDHCAPDVTEIVCMLVSQVTELRACVRELIKSPGREPCTCDWKPLDRKCRWCTVKENIIALIGEGGEEGK